MENTTNNNNAFCFTNSCWYTTNSPYFPEEEVYVLYTRFHGSEFIAVNGLGEKVTKVDHKMADGIPLYFFPDKVLQGLTEQIKPCEQNGNKATYVIKHQSFGDIITIEKETLPDGEVKFTVQR